MLAEVGVVGDGAPCHLLTLVGACKEPEESNVRTITRTRKILKSLKNHREKMRVHVNIRMSKIMRAPLKVGICANEAYANWWALIFSFKNYYYVLLCGNTCTMVKVSPFMIVYSMSACHPFVANLIPPNWILDKSFYFRSQWMNQIVHNRILLRDNKKHIVIGNYQYFCNVSLNKVSLVSIKKILC